MSGNAIESLFGSPKAVIGVVHLDALPGAPDFTGDIESVYARAVSDAETYADNGINGLIVENFGDAPFYPNQVSAETIASMSVVVREIIRHVNVPVGVNVLRNDAYAAMSIAAAAGAEFIRVNIHSGAALTDQGIIEGRAWETLRLRANIAPEVKIFADVAVKHAAALAPMSLQDETRNLAKRGRVDGIPRLNHSIT